MKKSICGANCEECPSKEVCPGCENTGGSPFGKQCFAAEYILTDGMEGFAEFKRNLADEINNLKIDGMEKVTELYPLTGKFVNLEYPLPNGDTVRFLKDDEMYLGTQVENLLKTEGKTCFGVVAGKNFILVCEYGENCENPKIVLYKRR